MTVLVGVAHGSKDDRSQDVVRALLDSAAQLRPGLHTASAYVDNASPSLAAAVKALVAEGIDDIAVVPLLLTAASHSKTDVAASVQKARLDHPGVRLRYGRPLGPHPALVDMLELRLAEAGARPDDAVLLVAGGSLDHDANAQIAATARLLWEGRAHPVVEVAFASTTSPSVPDALERLVCLGFRRVAVASYFLGPGRLPTSVARVVSAYDIEAVVAEPLGVADELARLVLERYDEAIVGDVRMNCDACLYRLAMPGREHLVGAPQVPHTHPDDE